MDASALDLLKKMLVSNPKKRITASMALSHPYLKSESENVSNEKYDSPCLTSASNKKSSRLVYYWWFSFIQSDIYSLLLLFGELIYVELLRRQDKILAALGKNRNTLKWILNHFSTIRSINNFNILSLRPKISTKLLKGLENIW